VKGLARALGPSLALFLALASGAGAHGRSVSWSSFELEAGGGVRLRARVPLLELTRLPELAAAAAARDPALGDYLAATLRVHTPAGPCALVSGPAPLAAPAGIFAAEWRVACPEGEPRSLESEILAEAAPSHLHFARGRMPGGEVRERVLSSRDSRWSLETADAPAPAVGSRIADYVALGVEHIASGADHLAFLLALILLAGTLGEVATLVTGFTVAHSVTLGLAALGLVHPDAAAVEALIGFSVALVAAENAWLLAGRPRAVPWCLCAPLLGLAALAAAGVGALAPLTLLGVALFTTCHFGLLARVERPARLRAAVAFAFGLVHGFGFAGVLGELALPRERLVPALFGFNLGVELGQLALVAAAWPALRALGRLKEGRAGRLVAELGSAAVCGLGVFWLLTRTYG
jgi:hypothetical protein